MLASLRSKGKNRNSLACLRNAGSYFAVSYCIRMYVCVCVYMYTVCVYVYICTYADTCGWWVYVNNRARNVYVYSTPGGRGGRGRRRRRKVYSKLTKRTERKVGRERENGLAGGMCLCMCVRARTLPFMTLCVSTDPVSRAVQKITKPLAGFAAVGAELPGSGVQFDRAESLVLFCTKVL